MQGLCRMIDAASEDPPKYTNRDLIGSDLGKKFDVMDEHFSVGPGLGTDFEPRPFTKAA